jgi:AraC-like DNA-binding protein
MTRIVFSTDQLPGDLDDQTRYSLWHDIYTTQFARAVDMSRNLSRPFSADFELALFGGAVLGKFEGGLSSIGRNARQIAAAPLDGFALSFSIASNRLSFAQRDRELVLQRNSPVFFSLNEPHVHRAEDGDGWIGISVPRRKLLERVPDADDLVALPLDPGNAALRHLRGYIDLLLGPDGGSDDPALSAHVESVLVDLIALTLGARRDAAELARERGLRASRLQQVLAEIKRGFADPAFSSDHVARTVGVSRRYVNDLLHASGRTFAERVLELRLQQAREMLARGANDGLRISDVALACGFNEVSYFHRCFRRRFGASPAQYRGSGADG